LNRFFGDAGTRRARVVCDCIAGMTDRYAATEHRRLFDVTPELQ
jgi:dGTPase